MYYTGSEIIMKLIEQEGVDTIAGIPGGANLPLYTALHASSINHILARHEQGAGFIAQGIARTTGKAGVCFATSGPGATNLLTAIADAYLDSIPMVAITGQVPTTLIGTDAFQEVNTYGLTAPITKHNFFVKSAKELLDVIPKAFEIAETGRPGPVVIDVPKDVQKEKIMIKNWPEKRERIVENTIPLDHKAIDKAIKAMHKAKKPVIISGGGTIHAGASHALYEIAVKNSIPVASTLMGLGAFPSDHELFIGMPGMHGAQYTNFVINEADLIFAVGIRFDDRLTGNLDGFGTRAKVIHIDIDNAEFNKNKGADITIHGDACEVMTLMSAKIEQNSREEWNKHIAEMKKEFPLEKTGTEGFFNPLTLIEFIGEHAPDDAIITTDVGQHQMWTAQAYPFKKPRTFLTSGGLGTMGFGLPAAIGASLANPDKKVICISGDGSIMMNLQELALLKECKVNITVVIMNNQHLGLVRQQQELFYDKNFSTSFFQVVPDFKMLSQSFGVEGYDLAEADDPAQMIREALSSENSNVINLPIEACDYVYPIVSPGKANHEMITETPVKV